MEWRGQRVVALASGDPFWFGAGSSLVAGLPGHEWIAHPAPSTFTLAAARLGWAIQDLACLGLHAAPLCAPAPASGAWPPRAGLAARRRGGGRPCPLARSGLWRALHVPLGGPRERLREGRADAFPDRHRPPGRGRPVLRRRGPALALTPGRDDMLFAADGQITKAPVRALTLAASPRAGELLWDIGAGSGSIGIEWLLAHPANRAVALDADPSRQPRAGQCPGAGRRPAVIEGARLPACLAHPIPARRGVHRRRPVAALLDALRAGLPAGTRLVANAVTLESEVLLAQAQGLARGQPAADRTGRRRPAGPRAAGKRAIPSCSGA
jgi:precorrin-6Y C5,15-methyltransferase (decarboxylating)